MYQKIQIQIYTHLYLDKVIVIQSLHQGIAILPTECFHTKLGGYVQTFQ